MNASKEKQPLTWKTLMRRLDKLPRPKFYLVFAGLYLFVLFFWFFLFISPKLSSNNAIKTKTAAAQQQVSIFQAKVTALSHPSQAVSKEKQEYNKLKKDLENIDQSIVVYKEDILPPSELPAALKKLLNNNGNLELLSLKHRELSVLNKSPTTGHIVYKAPFVMKLSGTFPNILNYLKKIEQLQWRFFWEELTYQVTTYPKATITLTINTLSEQKEDANE